MKISELKQPYKRMADYLNDENKTLELSDVFFWFYKGMCEGKNPEITEEIKKHFPPDFDFSGDVEDERRYNFAFKNNMEEKYTQLAKEGKFDELPDTCEFSEAVELEVWDFESVKDNRMIVGKFKNLFMAVTKIDNEDYRIFKYAQLPTPKIDFSQFKTGDVVEVETTTIGYVYGYIREVESDKLLLSFGYISDVLRTITREKTKSITKIK